MLDKLKCINVVSKKIQFCSGLLVITHNTVVGLIRLVIELAKNYFRLYLLRGKNGQLCRLHFEF